LRINRDLVNNKVCCHHSGDQYLL